MQESTQIVANFNWVNTIQNRRKHFQHPESFLMPSPVSAHPSYHQVTTILVFVARNEIV